MITRIRALPFIVIYCYKSFILLRQNKVDGFSGYEYNNAKKKLWAYTRKKCAYTKKKLCIYQHKKYNLLSWYIVQKKNNNRMNEQFLCQIFAYAYLKSAHKGVTFMTIITKIEKNKSRSILKRSYQTKSSGAIIFNYQHCRRNG
ncbi:hypothetical protein JL36_10070 [Lactococcus cremoris]|nr:hypothetical protein JL36_10070 [Lactococcus cremoris]